MPLLNTSAAPDLQAWEPNRWHRYRLADAASLPSPMLVTAFGHGKHSCPAQPFSLAAMTAAMTRLLGAYEMTPDWPNYPRPVPAQIGGVARSADPCPVIRQPLIRRNPSRLDVDGGPGDIAVAPRRQIDGDRRDLFGQTGAPEIARLVKVVVDPRHHVGGIGGVESVRGQDILEHFGEACRDDGAGTDAVDQNSVLGKAFRQILGDTAQRRLRCRVGDDPWVLPLNRMGRQRHDPGPLRGPQHRQRGPDRPHSRHRAQRERLLPLRVVHILEVPVARPDRVNQAVELTPPLRDGLEARGDRLGIRHVDADSDGIRCPRVT